MNKAILAAVAISVSNAALADWVKIAVTDKSTVYADPSSIRKAGNTASMWSTFDYGTPQQITMNGREVRYLSTRGQDEFDCKGMRKRRLLIIGHSKNMGGGDYTVTDGTQTPWIPVAPGTVAESMWKLACGKR
jgi:hypothetical protein